MSKKVEAKRRGIVVALFEKRLHNVGYTLCKQMLGEQCDNSDADCPKQRVTRGILLHWLGKKR